MRWKNILKSYNELLSIPIGIALFIFAPVLYRQYDPTAGAYDIGTLHTVVIAIIFVSIASGISWLMYKLNFPHMYKYFDDDMENNFVGAGYTRGLLALFPYVFYMVLIIWICVSFI